jgi:hypothetical protein
MITRSGIQKLAMLCLVATASLLLAAQPVAADDARLTIKAAVYRTEPGREAGVKTDFVRWYGYGPYGYGAYRGRVWGAPVYGYPYRPYVGVGVGIAPTYVVPAYVAPTYVAPYPAPVPVYGPAYGYPVYGYRYGW